MKVHVTGGFVMTYIEAGDFWGRVKQLCGVNQISLAEMARRAHISYGNLTRQITMKDVPTKYRQIKSIADLLGTTPEYLVDGERADENRPAPEYMRILEDFALLEEPQKKIIESLIGQMKSDNIRRYEREEKMEELSS